MISACAQVQVIVPNPRVEPPEARGEGNRFKIGGSNSSAHLYKATEYAGARPPDFSDPDVHGHYDFHPGGYYSPLSRLDLGVEINVLGQGINGLAKLQIFGEGTMSAKKGNVPVAIFARTGQASGENSGDQSVTFGDGGYPWKGKANASFVQAGISGGYRTVDWLLVYGGFAAGKYWTKAEITQDRSNDGSNAGGTYKTGDEGEAYTVSGGVMFSWRKFQVYVAGEHVSIDYKAAPSTDQISAHVGTFFTP